MLVVAAAGACAGGPPAAERERAPSARLVIECEVDDASVWVDDRYVGDVGHLDGGVALAPGTRRIEVRHDRYHTFYARIALDPRERKILEVHLARQLP